MRGLEGLPGLAREGAPRDARGSASARAKAARAGAAPRGLRRARLHEAAPGVAGAHRGGSGIRGARRGDRRVASRRDRVQLGVRARAV